MSQITACLLFILLVLAQAYARDTITPSESLNDGDLLVSSDETFALGFFSTTPGHKYVGIWYNNISVKTKVWVANRQTPITDSNVSLVITSNGTLAVTTSNSTILWSVNSSSSSVVTNPVAKLLDTGNFVVTSNSSEESFAWQSFDYPTDTLLPGMKLGYDLRTGLNRNLTAWKSETDPSPGDDCVAMNIHGDPELTVFFGYVKRWRSGPWTGDDFNGIPEMSTYTKTGFSFKFVDNSNEIYYSYDMSNKSILTRLMANNTGRVQRWVWTGQTWSLFWSMPNNACEYGKCGAYSTCDPNASPICACLDGFEPKSSTNWNLGDWSDGCMRKHRLDCVNGTDGFLVVKKAMLPDTSNSTVDRSLSLDQCRTTCLRNCSCTGYSNADVRNGGSGCIIWSTKIMDLRLFRLYEYGGQDFFVRLAAQDIESNSHESKTRVAIITVCTVVGFLLLVLTGYCILKRKKRRGTTVPVYYSKTDHNMGESNGGMKDVELPLIDFGTLMTATNNFSTENLLGEGGFGPVYKGKIGAGQEIAVKRLSKDSVQGIDEFKNEVMLIAKLQHRNLVRLQGYCIQGEEIMLIYEYMANGSLDAFLFDKSRGTLLDWKTRFHIIAGVARGLLYLDFFGNSQEPKFSNLVAFISNRVRALFVRIFLRTAAGGWLGPVCLPDHLAINSKSAFSSPPQLRFSSRQRNGNRNREEEGKEGGRTAMDSLRLPFPSSAFFLLLLFPLAALGSGTVFSVQRRFSGGDHTIADLKNHDLNRHGGRLLSAASIDFHLGGNGLANSTGLYFTEIGIGTPPKNFSVQVDSGSDILWVNCAPCEGCPKTSILGADLSPYDPEGSSSVSKLGCGEAFCSVLSGGGSPTCAHDDPCKFTATYGDGSSATGYYVTDLLSYNQVSEDHKTRLASANVTFGCASKQTGASSVGIEGLMGFGQANSSTISQLASSGKVRKIFAHCLDTIKGGGIFAVGNVVEPKVKMTPLIPKMLHYNVNLTSIDVGGKMLRLPLTMFQTREKSGTIIDSGTTLAYLPEIAYKRLIDQIFSDHQNLTLTTSTDNFTCFSYSESMDDAFPVVTFNFEMNVTLEVKPHDYFFKNKDVWCIGWQNNGDKDAILLGDITLSNRLVIYDLENQAVGWTDYDCSSSIKVEDDTSKAVNSIDAHALPYDPPSSASILEIGRSILLVPLVFLLHLHN